MRTDALDTLARTLVIEAEASPAAVIGAAGRSGQRWMVSTGAAGMRSGSHRELVDPSTPFDLASVTKPVVASAIARLVRRGRLRWETPIGELVTELSRTESRDLPLILFVSHRAGLEAHRALYSPLAATGGPSSSARPSRSRERRAGPTARAPAPIDGFRAALQRSRVPSRGRRGEPCCGRGPGDPRPLGSRRAPRAGHRFLRGLARSKRRLLGESRTHGGGALARRRDRRRRSRRKRLGARRATASRATPGSSARWKA